MTLGDKTAAPTSLMFPSRRRRLACLLYEAVLLFGVLFVAGYAFDTLTQSRHALHLRPLRQGWLLSIMALYFCWFWKHGGQTLAMKTWRIRLIGDNAPQPLTWSHCLWRFILGGVCTITGLGFLYSFFNAEKQWLQDRLSNSKVVVLYP